MTDATASSARFRTIAEAAVDDLLRLVPETATYLGDHRFDERLDDLSEDGLAGRARVLTEDRDALDTVDTDDLDRDDAVDAEILRAGLDRQLFALERLREHTWNPLVWLPGEALYPLLARDTIPVPDRLRALAARLAAVPERLALARATLERMPRVHVETAVTQTSGAIALIRDELPMLLAADPGLSAAVEPAAVRAAASLEEHRGWLADQLGPATGDPRLGPELFAAKLHLELDSDLSASRIATLALQQLAEVGEQLEKEAADWVGGGDDPVRRALDRIAAEAPDDGTIVAVAGDALARANALVRETGVVRLPDAECLIQVMPEFRRGVAIAYCDSPGPLETGGTTYYAIAPTPADWPAERVASFYREYNTALMTNLTVHEVMPGHVVQLGLARAYRGSTRVRQVLESGSFIEGWAVHAEDIMSGHGLGGVPVRLQMLKTRLRTILNALLDAGVHAEGMTEAEALRLMRSTGFQEEGEAVGKWRRALLTSAQLSTYFVGHTELAPLVAERERFDDVLAHGSPPPRHLRLLLAPRVPEFS